MPKSLKPEDNTYIDSTGIVHNRELLSNILQNNAIIVSPTEPTGNDRKKVWLRHENIFDNTASKTHSVSTNLTTIKTGVRATTLTGEDNTFACIDIGTISDFVGKKITVKFKNNSSTNKGRIYLGKSNVGQTTRQAIVDSGTVDNGTYIIQTDTIANDTTYTRLFLAIYSNGANSSASANTYVDYTDLIVSTVEDKTYILNNNEYKEYTPQNEIYSPTEQVIGTYLGKPVYKRTFVGTATLIHNGAFYSNVISLASNIDTILRSSGNVTKGSIKWEINACDFDNDTKNLKQYSRVINTSGTARCDFFTIDSSVSSISYIITLEYTKTTD